MANIDLSQWTVSTHSRLKAAGPTAIWCITALDGFNTQPPEGGWPCGGAVGVGFVGFNTQPPEGGWAFGFPFCDTRFQFQHTAA